MNEWIKMNLNLSRWLKINKKIQIRVKTWKCMKNYAGKVNLVFNFIKIWRKVLSFKKTGHSEISTVAG